MMVLLKKQLEQDEKARAILARAIESGDGA